MKEKESRPTLPQLPHEVAEYSAHTKSQDKRESFLLRESLLSMKEVLALTRWSRSTLYNRIRANEFVAAVHTGPRTRGWRTSAVLEFIETCGKK